ncbi:DUF2304 domain-containing protein [Agathobaculum sp. NTUH-O15-33]|uniref:DUF2304 domain-containing protein n=1 Tax=Agathobaculum sp. NTUH-O15-33 TaxID=3079302 RepID=UPI0029584F7D|nr:DUF2304 domain-containing protein [Agathobaculum sp. NTUH-O15-33]WNX84089.1 DUF2304 domain-containing protein [Agathobaculum sp. NTUH-O15-33]
MITNTLRVAMLIAIMIYFALLLHLLKKKSLNLKYTLLWILSGILMLLLGIFPQFINWFAGLVGIYEPTNALFAIIFFCIIIILMSLTSIVSKMNEKIKRIIQTIALLEKRVRELESLSGDEEK